MTKTQGKASGATALKKWAVIALFVVAAVLSAITAGKIAINYNLADYLGEDTQTKIALDIIEDEFGATGSIQVMAKNVSAKTAEEIRDEIEAVEGVLAVNFDADDEGYYKDGNALFIVVADGDDYSESAKQVLSDIKTALADYDGAKYDGAEYGGTVAEKLDLQQAITGEMVYILAISLVLVTAILLIGSESWIEPLVLLASSGVAVLINRGTNIFFGEISYITNSISAILQLALSVDYSIVLLHTYRREKERREKENAEDNGAAMKAAIKAVIKPVSASALTTIAGLLALLFMSFRIGFDIGLVLMKGIVISAITSVTLLPALVLLFDRLMKKTKKKAFVPKGRGFCKISYKAGKLIVPIALVLVVVCGVLQTGNAFVFSDTKAGNPVISETFGNNNSVVVVYKKSGNDTENERKLAETLQNYRTKDGKAVLVDYSAYSNTVLESYDAAKAMKKLKISEKDAELLLTMYNLYRNPSAKTATLAEAVDFANELLESDEDAKEFAGENEIQTLKDLKTVREITENEFTAEELYEKLAAWGKTGGAAEDDANGAAESEISAFAIKQLYGGYFYGEVKKSEVDFKTMLNFAIAASEDENFKDAFDAATVAQLKELSSGIAAYEVYYPETDPLRQVIDGEYGYESFLPVLTEVATAFTGKTPEIAVTKEEAQQLYIAYFYLTGDMPQGKMSGKGFAEYALSEDESNPVVHARLSEDGRNKLADMLTVNGYFSDASLLTYEKAYEKLSAMQNEIKSSAAEFSLGKDEVSGIYIKLAVKDGSRVFAEATAKDLLDFVNANMDGNVLLSRKMTSENREKVAEAKEDIKKAEDLFLGESYSRMLLSVGLPNESEETTEFVSYLSEEVKNIFGDEAYVAGEIVSTYDLEKSFAHDNAFITVFTLISVFLIVMLVFRSLSLPVILVAAIQGAIYIAMSTQLLGNGIFFMSYIVATCILMGATIDYGILTSSNYVAYRETCDKKRALELSVEAAMPTVFTSGLILTVCGFVIHFISGQSSISTVGLLLGIGTICSVLMITLVLPSALYILDKFVLKLSLKKKEK